MHFNNLDEALGGSMGAFWGGGWKCTTTHFTITNNFTVDRKDINEVGLLA